MMSMAGGKTKPEDIFPSIAQLKAGEAKRNEADKGVARMQQTLKSSVFGTMLANKGIE